MKTAYSMGDFGENGKIISLPERIKLAKAHMERNDNDRLLWPYQRFSMSIRELLDAAERGLNK